MRTPPGLRRKKNGHYFIRWAGRDHYLGNDRAIANDRYLNDREHGLPAWLNWQSEKAEQRRTRPVRTAMTVMALADAFLTAKGLEMGDECRSRYAKHLRRFCAAYGLTRAANIGPAQVQCLKDRMIRKGFAPKTVNHDVTSVKTMFKWGAELQILPPVLMSGVKLMSLGEIPDRSMSRAMVVEYLNSAHGNMRAWLAVTYLCGMRPSETVKLVNGRGEWVERGVFAMENKARRRCRLARHVLFTAEAFRWWRLCQPQWTRLDSFSSAVCTALGEGPHRLRHSAATHMLAAQAPRSSVDEWLGHYPKRVSLVYMRPQWQRLRALGRQISLRRLLLPG